MTEETSRRSGVAPSMADRGNRTLTRSQLGPVTNSACNCRVRLIPEPYRLGVQPHALHRLPIGPAKTTPRSRLNRGEFRFLYRRSEEAEGTGCRSAAPGDVSEVGATVRRDVGRWQWRPQQTVSRIGVHSNACPALVANISGPIYVDSGSSGGAWSPSFIVPGVSPSTYAWNVVLSGSGSSISGLPSASGYLYLNLTDAVGDTASASLYINVRRPITTVRAGTGYWPIAARMPFRKHASRVAHSIHSAKPAAARPAA